MQLNLSESESLTESEIDLVKDLGVRHGQKNDDTYYIDSINQLETIGNKLKLQCDKLEKYISDTAINY